MACASVYKPRSKQSFCLSLLSEWWHGRKLARKTYSRVQHPFQFLNNAALKVNHICVCLFDVAVPCLLCNCGSGSMNGIVIDSVRVGQTKWEREKKWHGVNECHSDAMHEKRQQNRFARDFRTRAAFYGAGIRGHSRVRRGEHEKTKQGICCRGSQMHAVRLLLASTTIRINIIPEMQSRQKRSGSNQKRNGFGVCHRDGTGAQKKLRKNERIRINKASQNGTFQN